MLNELDEMAKKLTPVVYGNAAVLVLLALYFFIIPAGMMAVDLRDPALRNGEIPRFAFRWHRSLSPRYERWAWERVESGAAADLSMYDISGTEWPVFGSVFYLWATEELQAAWETDPSLAPAAPKEYARGAIEAAATLVSDPNHATWVRKHWGDDYLEQENLFYRALLISGLTSYQKLLGDDRYQELIAAQAASLSQELDASPHGLLDDYPGQCYPVDILPAVAIIQRAGELLNTDYSEFVARALRGFEGPLIDARTGLPGYVASSTAGVTLGPARGVGMSFMLTWVPELWPAVAQQWYAKYEDQFWQDGVVDGFREFSRQASYDEWMVDVDAGPVIAGYGTAASAFGIGAARVNGRFDQAYPLIAEAMVATWPLPNGSLLGARALSNLSDAPYVGEAALLFNLTRRPLVEPDSLQDGQLPPIVYLALAIYLGSGVLMVTLAVKRVRRWQRRIFARSLAVAERQWLLWGTLLLAGLLAVALHAPAVGGLFLLLAQFLPLGIRAVPSETGL